MILLEEHHDDEVTKSGIEDGKTQKENEIKKEQTGGKGRHLYYINIQKVPSNHASKE